MGDYWILQLPSGRYCGSPLSGRATVNPNLAGCFTSEAEAQAEADYLPMRPKPVRFADADKAWRDAGKPRD